MDAGTWETLGRLLHAAVLSVFPAVMVYAALKDLRSYTLPNTACLLLAVAGLLAVAPQGFQATGLHLAAGAAVLAAAFPLFALRVMGGGDVKMMAAAAVWTGFPLLAQFLLLTAILGGLVGLASIASRRLGGRDAAMDEDSGLKLEVPYGVAIGGAGLTVFSMTLAERLFAV